MFRKRGKRGQVTIFVIIAIVIVAGIVAYFVLRDRLGIQGLPAKFQPVEQYFLSCVQEQAGLGVSILGSQGGYIALPDFEPGSLYSPFSNQLDFVGTPVAYWYYLSGNNIIKEQVPTKSNMESQLAEFIHEKLNCDFSQFKSEGYSINLDLKDVKTSISDNSVSLSIDADLEISFADETGKQSTHKTEIKTNLGNFYQEALSIYNYEKQQAFLENYAVDVLRLYAPVDGVEIDCAPKAWLKNDIDNNLKQALEANMQAIRLKGDYYTLKSKNEKYFVQELGVDNSVNFLYSRNWPTKIEILGSDSNILLAEPVGLQAGLGVLGFCYVPYHFVYNLAYPVLIQIYNDDELFQFPVAVVIDKNKARESLGGSIVDSEPELCKYKVQDLNVYTYDNNLNPVEADISFSCLSQSCDIGKTKLENNDAVLSEKFPQCGNGYVLARADGFVKKKYLVSTNNPEIVNIVLDRLYDLEIDLKIDSKTTNDLAIISFDSEDNSQTIVWPSQKKVELSEGNYNISIYAYRNGSISIPGMSDQKCSEVPKSGIAGILGMTEEKCFNVDIPSQTLENVISGGGKGSDYFVESQLQTGKIIIKTSSVPVPNSLEKLQDSYNILETNLVYVEFENA